MPREPETTTPLDYVERQDAVVAKLHGEIDFTTRNRLVALLEQVVGLGKDVVLDLSDLNFMDVGTARIIQQAELSAADHGSRFEVVNPHSIVRRLLILLGMDSLLSHNNGPVPGQRPNEER